MTEPFFFKPRAGLTVGAIADMTGAAPRGPVEAGRVIGGLAPLNRAGPYELTFLDNVKYAAGLRSTRAGACLISERFASEAPASLPLLITRDPYRAFVTAARALYPDALRPSSLFQGEGVAPGAYIHPSVRLESGVTVDPGAVIGPRAEIGSGTVIGAGAAIGANVKIGRDCAIGPNVSITHALIGDRAIIHAGCCIGQDGFGFSPGPAGHVKVPQVGRVIIQDDVEIGAGTAIDRGAIRDTVIGEGTKIDNHVQIAHNVSIGRHCIIVAQSGLAGSSTLGDYVMLGARSGSSPHSTIGEGAQLAAASVAHGIVPPGGRYGGLPAKPAKQWFREMKAVERLARKGAPSDGGDAKSDDQ
ncbi:MAG: UDP-3-O-(3-hydroxymyristoyl)glucosamine N-acyltransferase [Pseudorhodoplanes sp.]|nr:UDP-3-O-(3-hydroxymyristoyl)glucosamine N-acyltransferase [Pseudorhodoplanes sp.]